MRPPQLTYVYARSHEVVSNIFFFVTAEALTVEEPHSTFQRTSLDLPNMILSNLIPPVDQHSFQDHLAAQTPVICDSSI